MQIIKHILLWGFLLFPMTALAQLPEIGNETDLLAEDIEFRMLEYVDDFTQLATFGDMQLRFSDAIPLTMEYAQILSDKAKRLDERFQAIDLRWNTFVQAMQVDISDNEDLMNLMANVLQAKLVAADSITSKKQKCDALANFVKAEQLIQGKDSVYKNLYKKAYKLSLLKKTEPYLEKVKAQEQTLFTQIQENYGKAQQAVEVLPMLSKRMEALTEQYSIVQVMSKKIQQSAYQSLFHRIKDYLIGIACVAILLLLANMVVSKYKALKAVRKQMKNYQDLIRRQGAGADDYPTI